jgi:hypothetical protein
MVGFGITTRSLGVMARLNLKIKLSDGEGVTNMTVKELIDLLMAFPEDEPVYIPDFNSYDNHYITNAVLTDKGIALDY